MHDPLALIETHFLQTLIDQSEPVSPKNSAAENLQNLIRKENAKLAAFCETDEYRNSTYIKKLRQKDRDRQADEAWNSERRENYATAVLSLDGRTVRPYAQINDPVAKSENALEKTRSRVAKHRAAQTPEQIEERRAKDAERKRLKRAAAKTSGTP